MRVFKFHVNQLVYAFAAKTQAEAERAMFDEIGESVVDKIEEVPQSEWDEKTIAMYEDNDWEEEPFYVSIREQICGEDPQLIFTNDASFIN